MDFNGVLKGAAGTGMQLGETEIIQPEGGAVINIKRTGYCIVKGGAITGGNMTLVLENGTAPGQTKVIASEAATTGGTVGLTFSGVCVNEDYSAAITTLAFTAAGALAVLEWTGARWHIKDRVPAVLPSGT